MTMRANATRVTRSKLALGILMRQALQRKMMYDMYSNESIVVSHATIESLFSREINCPTNAHPSRFKAVTFADPTKHFPLISHRKGV